MFIAQVRAGSNSHPFLYMILLFLKCFLMFSFPCVYLYFDENLHVDASVAQLTALFTLGNLDIKGFGFSPTCSRK